MAQVIWSPNPISAKLMQPRYRRVTPAGENLGTSESRVVGMRKTSLLIAALMLAIALFGSGPAPAEEQVKTIAITASEFKFAPASLTLKRGARVALRITNGGTMDHEFLTTLFEAAKDVEVKFEGGKVEADEMEEVEIEKGHSVTIELTPTKSGSFRFWCAETFKGKLHRDLGMRGVIRVRP